MNNKDLQLIQQYLDGTLCESESDVAQLQTLLLESSEARSTLRTLATLDLGLHDFAASEDQNTETGPVPPWRTTSRSFGGMWTHSLLALASLAIIGLGTALWFQVNRVPNVPIANLNVVKVAGIGGEILWTGNGGQVTNELEVGQALTGGTIEGTSPTSWVELEFLDGSRVTVAGDSRLTFSDIGQKILHLKEGNVNSSVEPQPAEAPMLVYTRNAMLEVLGTEFEVEVESGNDATSLDVTEGKVRFKRLSDGQTVEVPANQRVQSSEGSELAAQPIPDQTSDWKSNLTHPYGKTGKWLPGDGSLSPRLKLVHYLHKSPHGESFLIKNAAMEVLGNNNERVVLGVNSKIRVRGYANKNQKAVFGIVVRNSNGDFGGYYLTSKPDVHWAELDTEPQQESGKLHTFEIVIGSDDLVLGLDLEKTKFAETPVGSVVDVFFSSTPSEQSELQITEVEIFRSDAN